MKKIYPRHRPQIKLCVFFLFTMFFFKQDVLSQDIHVVVTDFPYFESFEYVYGRWTQTDSDDFDWSLNVGMTNTDQTGPMAAYEGNCYIYTKAEDNRNRRAELTSSAFRLDGLRDPVLSFAYNMHGEDIGSLEILLSLDNGKSYSERIFSINGPKGSTWYVASIDLKRFKGEDVRFKIIGTTASGARGDMAIDYVYIGERDGYSFQDKERIEEIYYDIKVKTMLQDNLIVVEIPDDFISTSSLEIINIMGNRTYLDARCSSNFISIDISDFDSGLYFLRVYHQGETYIRKVYINQ